MLKVLYLNLFKFHFFKVEKHAFKVLCHALLYSKDKFLFVVELNLVFKYCGLVFLMIHFQNAKYEANILFINLFSRN